MIGDDARDIELFRNWSGAELLRCASDVVGVEREVVTFLQLVQELPKLLLPLGELPAADKVHAAKALSAFHSWGGEGRTETVLSHYLQSALASVSVNYVRGPRRVRVAI